VIFGGEQVTTGSSSSRGEWVTAPRHNRFTRGVQARLEIGRCRFPEAGIIEVAGLDQGGRSQRQPTSTNRRVRAPGSRRARHRRHWPQWRGCQNPPPDRPAAGWPHCPIKPRTDARSAFGPVGRARHWWCCPAITPMSTCPVASSTRFPGQSKRIRRFGFAVHRAPRRVPPGLKEGLIGAGLASITAGALLNRPQPHPSSRYGRAVQRSPQVI